MIVEVSIIRQCELLRGAVRATDQPLNSVFCNYVTKFWWWTKPEGGSMKAEGGNGMVDWWRSCSMTARLSKLDDKERCT